MIPEDEDRGATAMILPHRFNRNLFLASHRTKLFTADEVVKFIEKYGFQQQEG